MGAFNPFAATVVQCAWWEGGGVVPPWLPQGAVAGVAVRQLEPFAPAVLELPLQ